MQPLSGSGDRPVDASIERHAAQLLGDAWLRGSALESLGVPEALDWWIGALDYFVSGGEPIDPLMRGCDLQVIRSQLEQVREVAGLIASGSESDARKVLELAKKELTPIGGRFRIPIVYTSQATGCTEALLAVFERRAQDKVVVKLLNRGEGMRLHPLLEVRDSKRLYSYCTHDMELRGDGLFGLQSGVLSQLLSSQATDLGLAWMRQLHDFTQRKTVPEEIYSVLADRLAVPIDTAFTGEMAVSPQRSATSAHHLPGLLFTDALHSHLFDAGEGSPTASSLKRLSIAIKARALHQQRTAGDPKHIRAEIRELHASAEKLHGQQILDDEDLAKIHRLTDQIEAQLQPVSSAPTLVAVDLHTVGAGLVRELKLPTMHGIVESGGGSGARKAKLTVAPGDLLPPADQLLVRVTSLTKAMEPQRIAELHALLQRLPLPQVQGPNPYWDAFTEEDRRALLTALRGLMQSYGHCLADEQNSELPRAMLSMGSVVCIADWLARSLKGDPLKLAGFGLHLRLPEETFFFHRRDQVLRWREVLDYLEKRNEGTKKSVFGYLTGAHPWGVLPAVPKDEDTQSAFKQHLLYMKQFGPKYGSEELLALRTLRAHGGVDGLRMPEGYDDLHYCASVFRRLNHQVDEKSDHEDVGSILAGDQVPVLLHYLDKERQGVYHLVYYNEKYIPSTLDEALKGLRATRARVPVQRRQLVEYSPEAERVLFKENHGSENQVMHGSACFGGLKINVVHALQKIARLRNPKDYRLRLSELMDFCATYPTECRHPDVRTLIEHVLLQEGALLEELRKDASHQLRHQVFEFLAAQRERTAGYETLFDEHLNWVRLTADVEQLLPKPSGEIDRLLQELQRPFTDLNLSSAHRAKLALHCAYLCSLKPGARADLLVHWMAAHRHCPGLSTVTPAWMVGEVLRTIELDHQGCREAIPASLVALQPQLSATGAWSEWDCREGIFRATCGRDSYAVDPLAGRLLRNGEVIGEEGPRLPSGLKNAAGRLLKTEKTVELISRDDGAWSVAGQPDLLICPRAITKPKAHTFSRGNLGVEMDGEVLTFHKVEDADLLGVDLGPEGISAWSTYDGKRVMIEQKNGNLLVIWDGKNGWHTSGTWPSMLTPDARHYVSGEIKSEQWRLEETKRQIFKRYNEQLDWLLVREFEIDGKPTRWQKTEITRQLPAELMAGHTCWLECGAAVPRVLLLDASNRPSIVLTKIEGGYEAKLVESGARRVDVEGLPSQALWTRFDAAGSILAWSRADQLERVTYSRYSGLTFQRRGGQFECLQHPGFHLQTDELPEFSGASGYLLLRNGDGEELLLMTDKAPSAKNQYHVYSRAGRSGRWIVPNTHAALQLALALSASGNSITALQIVDQIGEEHPLAMDDWRALSGFAALKEPTALTRALLMHLGLRIAELRDSADHKDPPYYRLAFWRAVGHALACTLQNGQLPVSLVVSDAQRRLLQTQADTLGREPPRDQGGWYTSELGNVRETARSAMEHDFYPAPEDLALRARLERHLLDVDTRVFAGNDLRRDWETRKSQSKPRPAPYIHRRGGCGRYSQLSCDDLKRFDSPQLTTRPARTKQSAPVVLPSGEYERRPFGQLFDQLVDVQKRPTPVDQVDVDALVPESTDRLCEAMQAPLRRLLQEPAPTEAKLNVTKADGHEPLNHAIDQRKTKLESLQEAVERIANSGQTPSQRSFLASPQYAKLSVFDVLFLFNPDDPSALVARNPALGPEQLQELMRAAIDYMQCSWELSQLNEAVKELQDGNFTACAAVLDRTQPFDPYSCWWRSLYQCMSGNILRSDPDQSRILQQIFDCLAQPNSNPDGSQLNQLYFEFQAGGGKTKVLSAITALRCLALGKTPIFFSLPNLVDICRRDLQSSLSTYFHKRTHYYPFTLSTELNNDALRELLESLRRQHQQQVCLVMIPEGHHLLNLEYSKALSGGDSERIALLDQILSFFEEKAVFLIDEGHRNKDSLLNANIAIGDPLAVPAVYRALQREVFRWLAGHEELGLMNNSQASQTPEQRAAVIHQLLQHMVALPSLNVPEAEREALIVNYLSNKENPPPAWLEARFNSKDKQTQLQGQWIAQLRGLATRILPFTLSQKGMVDHGASIDPSNEVEAPRDHGRVSASKFEIPDIALALTFQGFLQRGLTSSTQFAAIIEQLQEQSEAQREQFPNGPTDIETRFLKWQKGAKVLVALSDINAKSPHSRQFQSAFNTLRKHPQIVLRYVSSVPAGQVSVFSQRLMSSAAGLSYGSALAIVFSATLGMRGQYTFFGSGPDDQKYSEDVDFLAKVIRKSCLAKNATVHMDDSESIEEYVKAHNFDGVTGHLDFGGICGARPSSDWSAALLAAHATIDGTLFATQPVDKRGTIGEKVLYLQLRGQEPKKIEGSDVKKLLNSPELRGKRILKLFGPEDTVGLDLPAEANALYRITIGENCCLDDLAQALLRLRQFLATLPDESPSQRIEWVLPVKVAAQIRKALNLDEAAPVTPTEILRWALLNQVARVREALTARAYQEIEAVYMRLLRAALRGKGADAQYKLFNECVEGVYKKAGYDPCAQWGSGCQQRPTADVLGKFSADMQLAFKAVAKELPKWATDRISHVIQETSQLLDTLEEKRNSDLNGRQVQKQHTRSQQESRNRQRHRHHVAKGKTEPRYESSLASKELGLEQIKFPIDPTLAKPASQLLECNLLPPELLLTRDTYLTHNSSKVDELWELRTAKPIHHLLVIKSDLDNQFLYIALSQEQASSYLEQLRQGKLAGGLQAGMVDIQGKWTLSMPQPPEEAKVDQICKSCSVLNGRLQYPKFIRALFKEDPQALQALWTKLEQIHLDPIPSWEAVLGHCSPEADPLKSVAESVGELVVKMPALAPRSGYFRWTGKNNWVDKPREPKVARPRSAINLTERRQVMQRLRTPVVAAPKPAQTAAVSRVATATAPANTSAPTPVRSSGLWERLCNAVRSPWVIAAAIGGIAVLILGAIALRSIAWRWSVRAL